MGNKEAKLGDMTGPNLRSACTMSEGYTDDTLVSVVGDAALAFSILDVGLYPLTNGIGRERVDDAVILDGIAAPKVNTRDGWVDSWSICIVVCSLGWPDPCAAACKGNSRHVD